jgi:hypothetical protein
MMDLTSSLAPYMYATMEGVRNIEADRRRWNVRLRQIRAAERLRQAAGSAAYRRAKSREVVKSGR